MTGGRARPIVAPPWVFYSSPFCVKGLWIRADICTAQVNCPDKDCGSKQWEPCKHVHPPERAHGRYVGWTHRVRREAAKKLTHGQLTIQVQCPGGPPAGGYTISLALPPATMEPPQ